MKKWEYLVLRSPFDQITAVLNGAGEEGWELVCSPPILHHITHEPIFIVKREKVEKPEKTPEG